MAVQEVFEANRFVLGDRLSSFEREYARYSGSGYCIGVGNGLDALTLALRSLDLDDGHEVIVPAHTYVATWLAVGRAGARIVAVDADPNTFNIDPEQVEAAVTPATRVILPVHMYGQACDMTALALTADKNQVFLVEDNAQAHGALWLEQRTGSFGVINATSFYPTKNLGALGDGGAVTTNDSRLANYVVRNRNYGMETKNVTVDQGLNSRLDEIQAAILRCKLSHLDEWNLIRRKIADFYLENLRGVGDLVLPLSDKEAYHVYHLFVVRTRVRARLQSFLKENGIETMIHYPYPPHLQPVYRELNLSEGSFPVAEDIAATALSLPMWPGMTDSQACRIVETIRLFFG